jgi:tetratricopeptide (TPR) repeat protein
VLAVGSAALVLASVHELLGWPPRDLPAVGALVGLALLAAGLLRVRRGAGTSLPWLAGSLVLFLGAAGPLGGLRVEGEAISVVRLAGALAVAAPLALFGHDRWVRHRIQARLVYGDARYDRRDVEASLAAYDRAATLAARAGVAEETPWCSKGAALVLLGRYEKALESLDTALRINPYHEVAWVNKGNALAKLGRPMDALRCYNSAIKVNPRYEVAWNNKGNALARLGRYGEALKAYEKALAIDPGYRGAWVNKGYVLAKLGRYDEAARCADRVLALPTAATPDG